MMHADHCAALRADPFSVFTFDKPIDAIGLDHDQIVDRAGTILGPISFIQVFNKLTWKGVTFITVREFPCDQLLTALDPARQAGLHFLRIIAPTTGTHILLPDISPAETAIDPAGSDQNWIDGVYHKFRLNDDYNGLLGSIQRMASGFIWVRQEVFVESSLSGFTCLFKTAPKFRFIRSHYSLLCTTPSQKVTSNEWEMVASDLSSGHQTKVSARLAAR